MKLSAKDAVFIQLGLLFLTSGVSTNRQGSLLQPINARTSPKPATPPGSANRPAEVSIPLLRPFTGNVLNSHTSDAGANGHNVQFQGTGDNSGSSSGANTGSSFSSNTGSSFSSSGGINHGDNDNGFVSGGSSSNTGSGGSSFGVGDSNFGGSTFGDSGSTFGDSGSSSSNIGSSFGSGSSSSAGGSFSGSSSSFSGSGSSFSGSGSSFSGSGSSFSGSSSSFGGISTSSMVTKTPLGGAVNQDTPSGAAGTTGFNSPSQNKDPATPQRPSQTSATASSSASAQKEFNLSAAGFGGLGGGSRDKSQGPSAAVGQPNAHNAQSPTPRPSTFGGSHAQSPQLSPSLLVLLLLLVCTRG
ncbi:uncharacterized transmembrane protein DDB_G0289901-like [Homarus americanus]|uniref:uncharacterized transmembrane protein DDB_G0289901-like n=1 Tax=Homarus americanus TaxID=6706 RepID=UPI001C463A65|nr:uncharacterized transmembrane protein DDB_G0289901-like [Homarus americanus]